MQPFTIDVLYGDHEGGQRTITRFGMIPMQTGDDKKWFPNVARHWNLDRPDPRALRLCGRMAMSAGRGPGGQGRRPRSSASHSRS